MFALILYYLNIYELNMLFSYIK